MIPSNEFQCKKRSFNARVSVLLVFEHPKFTEVFPGNFSNVVALSNTTSNNTTGKVEFNENQEATLTQALHAML